MINSGCIALTVAKKLMALMMKATKDLKKKNLRNFLPQVPKISIDFLKRIAYNNNDDRLTLKVIGLNRALFKRGYFFI